MILGVPLNLWGFAAITVPLVATPGASTAVVLRNSLAGGNRHWRLAIGESDTPRFRDPIVSRQSPVR